MKKTWIGIVVSTLVLALLAGCGGANEPKDPASPPAEQPATTTPEKTVDNETTGLADGAYYAEGEYSEKSGWKEVVALTVEGGKITKVDWNALYKDGGLDKKTSSKTGAYGMVANGNAQAEWDEQAAKMEAYLIAEQSADGLNLNDEGKTDAVSGVSIGVEGFSELVNKALAAGPTEVGPYKDGTYRAEAAEFAESSGWKENVTVTVINGKIAAVSWNGEHKDGGTDKVTRSASGEYGMVANGGAQAEWHEQAHNAEQYLLEVQDPAKIVYRAEDGKTDAIAGVSIHVNSFVELAQEALASAK
ncbi:hypothetical protein PA598K_04621 [Paenibacillus sp. 598K]|uniref:FMN-binding protein n=1 Tax=Paenibacillus sp. 598K TaxID=1117987 RepID=UPI000FFACD33|nr:FMN-binding protein [Paenibacillus sp. 598K]GBF76173.1 hypothetical protein PA598K_04621 [Paenibacillus sp. 598K]